MEERQRLEIAGRIRELRERSAFTQPQIAERMGLTLRGYQKVEERGTTKYEHAEALAGIHGVTPEFIWDGDNVEKAPAPNLMDAFSQSDLERLRAEIAGLKTEQTRLRSAVEKLLGVEAESRPDEAPEQPQSPSVPGEATGG